MKVRKKIISIFKSIKLKLLASKKGYHYVPNIYGRSAEKQIDIRSIQPFANLAKSIIKQSKSMLYYDRLYTIFQGLQQTLQLSPGASQLNTAEVGVYKGGTSYFIASVLKTFGFDFIEHYCFDTFEGHIEQDINVDIETHHRAGKFKASYREAKEYLKCFSSLQIFKGRFQDTCSVISEKNFRFVHLDIDLYEPTIFALHFFNSRLAIGGVIVIDDYIAITCPGIVRAVQKFSEQNKNYVIFGLLTGQCLLIKYKN